LHLANADSFAVDDCILLVSSENFRGWERREIVTAILPEPLPIPDDLAQVQKERLPSIEQRYFNSSHYRLVSATPANHENHHLKVVLAPIRFYDYFSLSPAFDVLLLIGQDRSAISIRQKYGHTALSYSDDETTSQIPAPISIQCIVVTGDEQIVLMQRSKSVAFYPQHWSASFEETMDAPDPAHAQKGDKDFFDGAIRGLDEEFGIFEEAVESVKVLSLNVEYQTLSVDVITLIKLKLTAEEVKQSWLLRARDREEASRFATIPADLNSVLDVLMSERLWHPTSRMRLIQFLFQRYSVKEVVHTLQFDQRKE
jgi:hypothetical protein